MALDDRPRLGCGVALEALMDQITEPEHSPDAAHQAVCVHCQAALVALREAWGEYQSLARQPIAVPGGLSERIMARIAALVGQWDHAAVLGGVRGETRISERALGQAARRAALAVPGVVLASAVSVAVNPADRGRVRLGLRLVIVFGPAIDGLAAAVRERVSTGIGAQMGVSVERVDIAVEDVLTET